MGLAETPLIPMMFIILIFCPQSQPTKCKSHHQGWTRHMDLSFIKLNSGIDAGSLKLAQFFSQWCKGRIRRTTHSKRKHPPGHLRRRSRLGKQGPRRHPKSHTNKRSQLALPLCHLICQSNSHCTQTRPSHVSFSTQQFGVGMDSRATSCMSNDTADFVAPLVPVTVMLHTHDEIKEVQLLKGTMRWHWTDNEGREHRFDIPNSHCDPCRSVIL